MVDRLFVDSDLAALYDIFFPADRRSDLDFYLELVMSARSVLDVGWGTGALLHRARESGHTGRLCGLDPAVGMLGQAQKHPDIEWILGDLDSVRWENEFDLAVMTGHAFQVFVEDDDLRRSLTAIRSALTDAGRFAFETRNPLVREWESWSQRSPARATAADGSIVHMTREVATPVEGDVVRFSHTFTSSSWPQPQTSRSVLRFLDVDALSAFLSDAGFVIEQQFGDWAGHPISDTNPEIITIAKRS